MENDLVPFQVYRWEREDRALRLRYIASDGRGQCAFYDLDQSSKTRTQRFEIYPESDVLLLLGNKIKPTVDDERGKLPAEATLEQRYRDAGAARWAAVERIFSRKTAETLNEDEPAFTDAIYFEPALFRILMRKEARRQGRKNASRLYQLFWTCIRYGGDKYALTDRHNQCGGPGKPRSTYEHSEKTGRKSAAFYRDPSTYVAKNRFGRFWRRRVISAIVTTVACNPASSRPLLENPTHFRRLMLEEFCSAGCDMRVRERRKIPAAETPKPHTMERQGMAVVRCLAEQIAPLLPPPKNRPVGLSTDIALGDEVIADMDVTDFDQFRIAFVTDDESEIRDLGAPRVALGVVRGSDYILGYSTTIGYERTELYEYCLLSMLTSKTARLRELGFVEPLKGMESGNVDVVLVDGGPGSSKGAKAFTLQTLKVDHAKVPPYFPQGKGNVEGSNYRLKGRAYSNMHLADGVFEGVIHELERMSAERRLALRHGQGLTPELKRKESEGLIYVRERVFERVLVEAINEHNLAVLTRKSALTQSMFATQRVPTRLEAFQEQKELRRGDRAYQRTEAEIRKAILLSTAVPATVLHGLVTVKEGQYGGKENLNHESVKLLMEWESVQRFKNRLRDKTPVKIRVSPSPHGNLILWHAEGREPQPIPPTDDFRRLVGADADRGRVVAIYQWALADKAKEEQKQADGKLGQSKKFSKEARAEADKIRQSRGFEPVSSSRPQSEAAKVHRKREAQERYKDNAAAAGVDIAMAASNIPDEESFFVGRLDDDPYDLADLRKHLRDAAR